MGNKKILIILGLAWAGIIAYNVIPAKNDNTKTESAKRASAAGIQEPRLGLLNAPHPPYKQVTRDIFSPVKIAVAKAPSQKMPELPPPPVVKEEPPPPPPPSPVKIFASELRFIGFYQKTENKKTVFLKRGQDVFLVKKGDTVDGKFRVVEVSDNALTLSDETAKEEARVDLVSR